MGLSYSVHDYRKLVNCWRHLTKVNSMKCEKFYIHNDMPVHQISNYLVSSARPCLYISTGIHGDDPAPCWAVLEWANENQNLLNHIPVVIFPCLNPWGFINNCRNDRNGDDLNRVWGNRDHPLINLVFDRIGHLTFSLSLNLHEDFDANGIYLYEPYSGGRNDTWAEKVLSAGKKFLPIDDRRTIDGRTAKNGIIRPRINNPPKDGYPEALYFANLRSTRNFTFETPSEESFYVRSKALQVMIEQGVKLAFSNQ